MPNYVELHDFDPFCSGCSCLFVPLPLQNLKKKWTDSIQGLHVHSTCCSAGAAGVSVSLNGTPVGEIGENGELKLPNARGSCRVGIQGGPSKKMRMTNG